MSESKDTSQPSDLADLKRRSVSGGVVVLIAQVINIGIQLVSTIVLSRLLTPNDYGVMAMVMSITAFAGLFRDMGLSSATIQRPNLTEAQQSNLFWVNVAMGTLLTATICALSPAVAWFYQRPEILSVMMASSGVFMLGSLSTQHGARLIRSLKFGRHALAGIAGGLVGLGTSIILAIKGYSYWSLVWGNLLSGITTTILIFTFAPFLPSLPRRGTGVKEILMFGANVTAFDFINYFHRNLDKILIGRFDGPEPLGLYNRAYSLLMLPINSIRGPINSIGFPAMSQLSREPEAFRAYYIKITNLLALLSMPLMAFLLLTSDSVIEVALGKKWLEIVPIFSILATVGFVQPVVTHWGIVVLSLGMGSRYLSLGIVTTVSSGLGFLLGLPWGPVGVAVGYAASTYIVAIPTLIWAFRDTPIHLRDFFLAVGRPALASIIVCSIGFLFKPSSSALSHIYQLLIVGPIFGISYLTILRLLPGGHSDFVFVGDLIRTLIGSIKKPSSSL